MRLSNNDAPIIVISSSSLIFILFLITILLKVELILTMMFVVPITVVSTTGMILSYKYKVTVYNRTEMIKPFPKKYKKHLEQKSETKPLKSIHKTHMEISDQGTKQRILENLPKKEKKSIKKKLKKKKSIELLTQQLTQEELEDLKKTESEVDVETQKFICIVHKGPIEGNLYLCPYCKTFYCHKCANALREKGDKCWSCEKELEITKKITQELQKRINSLNSLINHYKIRLQTLDVKFRMKRMDKLAYYEEKEVLTEKFNQYSESLNKLKKKHLNDN